MNESVNNKSVKDMIKELQTIYGAVSNVRFPYEDIRNLLREADGTYEGLNPDLDLYFSTIAGYCSWGEKILKWRQEKILEVQKRIAKPFFEKHPKYKPLEGAITESATPDLFALMAFHEKMRWNLLELLDKLKVEHQ